MRRLPRTACLTLLPALLTVLIVAVADSQPAEATKAEAKTVGAVGVIRRIADDRKSFEIKSKGLPKTQAQLASDDIVYLHFEGISLAKVKDGDPIYVLGIPQEAQQNMGPQLGSIRAVVSGAAFVPPELPASLKKVKGLAWMSGSLSIDGKKLMLGEHQLSTGTSRRITKVSKGGRDKIDKKAIVYVFGKFHKKAKGEKFSRLVAEKVYVLDKKVPSKEYGSLFTLGLVKNSSGLDF